MLESELFKINFANGSPIEPAWMKEPFHFRGGIHKIGLGGLRSSTIWCATRPTTSG